MKIFYGISFVWTFFTLILFSGRTPPPPPGMILVLCVVAAPCPLLCGGSFHCTHLWHMQQMFSAGHICIICGGSGYRDLWTCKKHGWKSRWLRSNPTTDEDLTIALNNTPRTPSGARIDNSSIFEKFRVRGLPEGSETAIWYIENKKSFRNGSRPRAGWPMRLVLVRATPRAEDDVISVQRC